jgi:hypothetical protein
MVKLVSFASNLCLPSLDIDQFESAFLAYSDH